jgi:DNA-directed RNA polymerase specialized sigma24 family protein
LTCQSRRGDETSKETLLARVLPVLRGLARSKLWVEEREDGLQEAALKILERLDRVDLAQSETSIKNYLETIGLCKIKDLAKRLSRQRAREPYLETEEDELAGEWREPEIDDPAREHSHLMRLRVYIRRYHGRWRWRNVVIAYARWQRCTVEQSERRLTRLIERHRMTLALPIDPRAKHTAAFVQKNFQHTL